MDLASGRASMSVRLFTIVNLCHISLGEKQKTRTGKPQGYLASGRAGSGDSHKCSVVIITMRRTS